MILLTPGPCMTTDSVRLAGAMPDLNHREPAYLELIAETKQRLLSVYPGLEEFVPYILGGSGTAAVEAMITSCVSQGPVLLLDNGYYCARQRDILEIYRIPHKTLSFDWLAPIDLERLSQELSLTSYEAVLMTHNETTSGRLNDLASVSEMAARNGAKCLVDAMSSFGADPLPLAHVDALAASANKCLHSLPGVGFVLVRQNLAKEIASYPRRTYYLSLPIYSGDQPPLTPPVSGLAAFRQALREMEGGASGRERRYKQLAGKIRAGLHRLGFEFAIPEAEFSCTLTTATIPAGWTYDRWFQANLERGFVIYACKGPFRNRFFQVANMGDLREDQISAWLQCVSDLLKWNPVESPSALHAK